MRLQVAALAASLAVTAGASAPVFGVSTQDTPRDGIRLFLLGLERVVQQSDVAAYNALLAESADRGRSAGFIDAELIPGMTRAVIQERDRSPLAGTVPGDGYSIVVDTFEEYGDRARVSTWWLDLKRNRDAMDTDTEWLIADQGPISSVEDLYRISLDPAKQFTAHNFEFSDEDLKLTLIEGSVFVSDTDQGTTALVLVGRGDMSFRPTPLTEKSQVRIFSGADTIETRFDAAYIRINPDDLDRFISTRQLVSRPVDRNDFRAADRIFRDDSQKSYTLELGDLSRDTWSLVPLPRDLVAEIHTRRFNTLTYSRSSSVREDINLFDRNSNKTIALYSSPLNDRHGVSLGDEEGAADFTVSHYDVDVSSFPERRWIEGRARLSIRVGQNLINTLTLQLAEPLVVQSVVSNEYGRLFSMRVKNQNSVVVSLPMTLSRGAEMTLTVTYAGRLEPQTLDAESMAVGQRGAPQLDADGVMDQYVLEPSFVYSNQSNWYPRPSASHYATARLRITVPANLACVASGERDAASPVPVTTKDPSRRKTYVFNAVQPLRYLAFVVSRFATAQNIVTEHLKVSVEANPGHAKRGREVAERAVDIARFYQSLLDDSPYPSFTVALTEGNLPGGHSPGYFAVLNEPPLPLLAFAPRNDPASFGNYPDFFLAHELAHQWWGQAVGWRTYHEQWLSEGFSQYFAALYAQQRGPGGPGSNVVFRGIMRQMRNWAIDETDQGPISLGYRLGHIQGDGRIRRAIVYDKGALVLHMLRGLVGDDAFFRGLRRFYRTSRFRSADTSDFWAAMEWESGRSLGRFFERWIYGSTLPRLNFSYRVDGENVVLHI
ncbi:MAG: M1 family aminopeptidase, partial [Vicinamibacterales bacterium]|nr:M1 family aminopeptidase [Vicinamibacterales bacterium]